MANHKPISFGPSTELIPADEEADIEIAVKELHDLLEPKPGEPRGQGGDIHVKSHGCATAELRVLPNLPAELAQGMFARERTFSAVVRFSNSSPQPQHDLIPDGRGMAIKVLEVEGERLMDEDNGAPTQDFILVNHPVFFAPNVKEFVQVERLLARAKEQNLADATRAFTRGDWNPLNWHWQEAITALRIASHAPASPAAMTYYSMSPFRYGEYVCKYRARPAAELPGNLIETLSRLSSSADAMRMMLEETLRAQHLLFEFQVQLRTSIGTMPVEDATVEWPERDSPYRTVALLLIPRQEINTAEQKSICERLSFNVWHSLEEHRPLGGINRLRRRIYPLSAATRRKRLESAVSESSV
jgi:catalase